jgi:hypothetical protein
MKYKLMYRKYQRKLRETKCSFKNFISTDLRHTIAYTKYLDQIMYLY